MTAMGPTVRFGSFDAELAWRPTHLAQLPAGPGRANGASAAMDELLAAGCDPGDVLLTGAPMAPALVEALAAAKITFRPQAVPGPPQSAVEARIADLDEGWLQVSGWPATVYAVLPDTASAVAALGLRAALPQAEVAARINSKTWSNDFAQRRALPGTASVARSPEQVRRLVAEVGAAGAVVKDPYGVSGRGALRITTPRILDTVLRYLQGQVSRGAEVELLVQPYLDAAFDFSTHFTVGQTGNVDWLGVQMVDNDAFAYRGSGPVPDGVAYLGGDAHRALVADLAAALFAEDYTGPVCVDGMALRDGTIVPILEVNARHSMGWLNLRLDRRAQAVGLRSWLRCRSGTVSVDDPADRLTAALAAGGWLFDGERPGVLPLGTRTLTRPRGRLFYGVFAADPEQMRVLDAVVGAALGDALNPTADAPA